MTHAVGALGSVRRARVDGLGTVAVDDAGWELAWWIGADDRWHVPARERTVRQSLVDAMPVVRTAIRVPGGDAVQRVYGVGGVGDPIVVEIENASGAPFVVAFVVRGARSVRVDGPVVSIDHRSALVAGRPPARWAVERGRSTDVIVCSGGASDGPFPVTRDRAGRIEAAFLHPVAHRAQVRVAIVADGGAVESGALGDLPDADAAARGWWAHLARGMRVDGLGQQLSAAVATARAAALLAATSRSPTGMTVAALEDWGFDREAAVAWSRLSGRERRHAAGRPPRPAAWDDVRQAQGAELLVALRSMLVHEQDGSVAILSELPNEWKGQPIDVHDAPTRHGPVSFGVRWHGARPALLWSTPSGLVVCAPGLDAGWTSRQPEGEVLLGNAGA